MWSLIIWYVAGRSGGILVKKKRATVHLVLWFKQIYLQTIVFLVWELAWVKALQTYLLGASLQAGMLLGICSLKLLGSRCHFSAFVALEQVPGSGKGDLRG